VPEKLLDIHFELGIAGGPVVLLVLADEDLHLLVSEARVNDMDH
jgi:hypothetical protein